ncbi:MAG: histidine kinase dimerization/phospho-acceptor domain-containing protein [Candidatus Obscuribacterales bacterium]
MRLSGSLIAKVALMLSLPLLFELTVISVSIKLLGEIDQARIERRLNGELIASYVNVFGATISDYIDLAGHIEGKERTSKHSINKRLVRTIKACADLEIISKAAGVDIYEIQLLSRKSRLRLGLVPWGPKVITSDNIKEKVETHALFITMLEKVDNLIGGRLELLKEREIQERELFYRMNALLLAALAISLLLSICLCLTISKMILERLSIVKENTERFARQEPLLPVLRGDDEIANLDRNFRAMVDSLAALEERDHAVLNNSIDVIGALDAEHCFKRLSLSSELLWGCVPGDLTDRSISEIVAPQSLLATVDHLDRSRQTSTPTIFENETVSQDGTIIPARWSVQWSERDELFVCIIHDQRKRKEAEARRDELLALVSHDLRSPLTTARLRLESILASEDLRQEQTEKLLLVNGTISYVIATINDLIDLLRFQKERASIEPSLWSLARLEKRLREYLKAEEIPFYLSLEAPADTSVMVDEEYMPRIVAALVRHARLARADRPCEINIGLDETAGIVFIRVEPSEFRKLEGAAPEPPTDTAIRISYEVSLALCREVAGRLHGSLKTYWSASGKPSYQLNLPMVSLG